ncbi:unnamed protein product [Cuscuta epithymum]|uniref:Pectin acetylesterase n=1 Tax=Cuscuta epithymum TaxID=186058 RepID=A0AAV0FQ39_9ASTE|nr:unnamed protein product [Cuscuta epithymum]
MQQQLWGFCVIALSLVLVNAQEDLFVDITILESAVKKGAVCLDGSPPAYHLHRGCGTGINNWLIQLEGGGWCENVTTCMLRKRTRLGSSKYMNLTLAFSGILHNNPHFNPDFFNWNKVKVRYCDGASFTGNAQFVDRETNLHFRGARIFQAIMDDLLANGMDKAENAILSGCSAGGLASILHCDKFRKLFPREARVKCFSDAGFFINVKDISGEPSLEKFYTDVVKLHVSANNLPKSCTSKLKASLCFFPQNVAPDITTPLFLINAAYDTWQIRNALIPSAADPSGKWKMCKTDIRHCSVSQLNTIQDFRSEFLAALKGFKYSPTSGSGGGYFINSCFLHCQTELQELWNMPSSPMLLQKTIAEAAGDWFFDRKIFRKTDSPYPDDKSCSMPQLVP